MAKRPSPSQGWDDTSHHHQQCSCRSQRHQTSGCTYHKSCAEEHISEKAVLFHSRWSIFIPLKSVWHIVFSTAHTFGWSIFHSHLLILQFWCTTSAARVQVAAVSRDRRRSCFTFIERLFFPTLRVTSVKPLHEEGMEKGEPRARGFISVC